MLEGLLKGREEGALALAKVESDTFSFRLLPYSKPSIQAGDWGGRAGGGAFPS